MRSHSIFRADSGARSVTRRMSGERHVQTFSTLYDLTIARAVIGHYSCTKPASINLLMWERVQRRLEENQPS